MRSFAILIPVVALGACSHPQNPERRDPLQDQVTGSLQRTDPLFLKDDPARRVACHADAQCPPGALCLPDKKVCFTSYPPEPVLKIEESCPLVPLYFAEGSTELVPEARQWVDYDAQCLRARGANDVVLDGFADARGSKEVNVDLSRRRAETVKQALEQRGATVNIAVRADGATELIGGSNEHDFAYDRRVELTANH